MSDTTSNALIILEFANDRDCDSSCEGLLTAASSLLSTLNLRRQKNKDLELLLKREPEDILDMENNLYEMNEKLKKSNKQFNKLGKALAKEVEFCKEFPHPDDLSENQLPRNIFS